jgi:hypothetical protein
MGNDKEGKRRVITENGFALPEKLMALACPVFAGGPPDGRCGGGFPGMSMTSIDLTGSLIKGRFDPYSESLCDMTVYRAEWYYRTLAATDPVELARQLADPMRVPEALSQAPEQDRIAAGLVEANLLVSIAQAALVRFGIPPITHASEVAISQG